MKKIPGEEARVVGCTLFEGHYHHGLAALVNSLCRYGYQGVFFAGFRGELPPWCGDKMEFRVNELVTIQFLRMEKDLHFTFCKPMLMNSLFEDVPAADAVIYFDPDVVLKCPWKFLVDWVEDRIALCLDVNWHLHRSHPVRQDWDRHLKPHGFHPKHQLDYYCNAGFVGTARSQRQFLQVWEKLMELLAPLAGERKEIWHAESDFCFHKMDQDTLNVVADLMPDKVSLMGPEAMDFTEGGHTMSHAVGSSKPWRSDFVWNALKGMPPSKADKAFYYNAREPIAIFSEEEYSWRAFNLRVAAAIGRFIRRSSG